MCHIKGSPGGGSMQSWKVRLSLVLTMLGMLFAVSAPAVAQTDAFLDLADEVEEECDDLGDEDFDGLTNGDDEQDCLDEVANALEDCADAALDALEDGDEADIECDVEDEDDDDEDDEDDE